jgi:hypothetical protein
MSIPKIKNHGGARPGAGRPTGRGVPRYRPEFARQAHKLCLLGATDAEIVDFFEIDGQTFDRWNKRHPEFREALRTGKALADGNVALSLHQRAIGYERKVQKVFMHEGQPITVEITEHVLPDVEACVHWLANRQPKLWRYPVEIARGTNPKGSV